MMATGARPRPTPTLSDTYRNRACDGRSSCDQTPFPAAETCAEECPMSHSLSGGWCPSGRPSLVGRWSCGRYRCATPWSLSGLVQGLRGLLRLYDPGLFQESRGGFEGVAFPTTACLLRGPISMDEWNSLIHPLIDSFVCSQQALIGAPVRETISHVQIVKYLTGRVSAGWATVRRGWGWVGVGMAALLLWHQGRPGRGIRETE